MLMVSAAIGLHNLPYFYCVESSGLQVLGRGDVKVNFISFQVSCCQRREYNDIQSQDGSYLFEVYSILPPRANSSDMRIEVLAPFIGAAMQRLRLPLVHYPGTTSLTDRVHERGPPAKPCSFVGVLQACFAT